MLTSSGNKYKISSGRETVIALCFLSSLSAILALEIFNNILEMTVP